MKSFLFIFILIIPNILISNSTRIIYVDDDNIEGPWYGTKEYPFRFIEDGIDASSNFDTVFVCKGIYNESITIDKPINLIGEGETFIDGGYSKIIINVTSSSVLIENLTIRNSSAFKGSVGIKINSKNVTLKGCTIYRTKTGIYVEDTSTIKDCILHNNGKGIVIKDRTSVDNCLFFHNSIGILSESSSQSVIEYSTFSTNGIALLIENSSQLKVFHCNVSDNSVNLGGIFILGSNNIKIEKCILRHNGAGVSVSSSNVSIINSSLSFNTHYAIILRRFCRVRVLLCDIRDNLRFGVYIDRDNLCSIAKSNIHNNTLLGVYSKSRCIARNNWWGSRFPFGAWRVIFFPWLLSRVENAGCDWRDSAQKVCVVYREIELPGRDSDEDGAPDWWERKWGYNPFLWEDHANLDPDGDALNNIEECFVDYLGSNPFRKDIFLEIDWMESGCENKQNKPPTHLIDKVVSIFDKQNITLHVDLNEEIPLTCIPSFSMLQDLYSNYFLHNDLNNPRKGIFRYGIICNYCPDVNFPFFGWDNFDSFAISAEWLKERCPGYSRGQLIVGAIVHHLGHSLGLLADTYEGIDNLATVRPFTREWWKYRNYKSCMNYWYKYALFSYSDGTNGFGDFDDWDHLDFGFFKNTHFELKNKIREITILS
jgi:parallel beta-helix repeat protein